MRKDLARQMPSWSKAKLDVVPAALGDTTVLWGALEVVHRAVQVNAARSRNAAPRVVKLDRRVLHLSQVDSSNRRNPDPLRRLRRDPEKEIDAFNSWLEEQTFLHR